MKELKFLLLILSFALFACDDKKSNGVDEPTGETEQSVENNYEINYEPTVKIPLTDQTRSARDKCEDFSFSLLMKVDEEMDKNVCFSPFSIYNVLAILANTEKCAAHTELMQILNADDSDAQIESINQYCALLLSYLPKLDSSVELHLANAVFFGANDRLNENFTNKVNEFYGNDGDIIRHFDNTSEYVSQVNMWVEAATKGMISNFLHDEISFNEIILNAGYFNGTWATQFDKNNTKKAKFSNGDGSESKIDFMSITSSFNYMETSSFTGTELLYGNGQYSMILAMPNEGVDGTKFDMLAYNDLISKGGMRTVNLSLPRFELESELAHLTDLLGMNQIKKIGFENFFANKNDSFVIDVMPHKTKISVTEQGTEGGVATGAYNQTSSFDEEESKPVNLIFNRPFYFLIKERTTNTIFFIGKVNQL